MMSDFPRRAGIRERLQHVWNRYLTWGVQKYKPAKGSATDDRLGRSY